MNHLEINDELNVLRDFIDFLNRQVGVYIDCLASFQGNVARVERQVTRVSRKARITEAEGRQQVMWASFEDPSSPDIIHNRIVRIADYVSDNSERGFNQQQVCWAIIVFVFAKWDEETRPKLAAIRGIEPSDLSLDAFGDLRTLRKAIVHNGGLLTAKEHGKLLLMSDLCGPDIVLTFGHDEMHRLFVLLKQAVARLILEHTGHLPGAPKADDLTDIAIE